MCKRSQSGCVTKKLLCVRMTLRSPFSLHYLVNTDRNSHDIHIYENITNARGLQK